jgi:aminopeptidase N
VAHEHGTALTDDLMTAVERRAGTGLGWFFDQWLRRPGFARITTGWHYDAARRRVVLEVSQTDARSEPYRFPLTVAVTDAAGAVHRVRVDVPARRATLLDLPLEVAAQPRALAIDPDVELLAEFREK